jgi:predicted nucleotidyltransferase
MSTTTVSSNLSSALFGLARRSVLGLLFGHPEKAYYLREIARMTGLGLGAVQREVQRLCAAGIIRRTAQGRQVYFQANAQNPVFPELKGLVAKTSGVGEVLKSALHPIFSRIRVAFIFGSFAKREQRPDSDVDILVIGDADFEEVAMALSPAQRTLGREVNPAVYSVKQFRSKLRERHHFLTSVVRSPKIFLIGDDLELERLGHQRMAH